VSAVDTHGITVRLSCNVCRASPITMWAEDPPTSGSCCQHWVHSPTMDSQFLQLHCPKQTSAWPSSKCFLNHSYSRNTRNAESTVTPRRLVMNLPAMEVTPLETALQSFNCLHKISVSLPSSPTKEDSLVTSCRADKQVQVLSTMPCLEELLYLVQIGTLVSD